MANTYVAIATVTVGSGGASTIDFTSIPNTYTDLCLLLSSRTLYAALNDDMSMRFNGSSSGYSNKTVYGNGASPASGTPFTDKVYIGSINANTSTSSTFSNTQIYIPNYASSNNKSVSIQTVMENNASTAYAVMIVSLWSNSSAISSISLGYGGGSNWSQYTTATLYGIKNS